MEFDYNKQPGLSLWNRPLAKNGKPLISIITAFYNTTGSVFEQTYNCVMNQTFPWFEWIIVDDGSTNRESLETLERLAGTDVRIRVIHQENTGISNSRNVGIKNSCTDLIFSLDSDDLIEPTYLEYAFWSLHYNPDAAWAYADSVGFQDEEYLWAPEYDPEREKTENLLSCTALIRKQAIVGAGMYKVLKFHFNEDWYLWLSIMANGGFPVQMKGEYLFWYRRTKKGVLGAVTGNQDSILRNKKIIEEQASFVIDPRPPVVYPKGTCKHFEGLQVSKWTQKVYAQHNKIHVLFLFPWFSMGGADKFNLDLIKGLDKEKYAVSIITTVKSDNVWLQLFRDVTPEIFNLPNFLSPNDFAQFVDYFIRSREIDLIFQSNSTEGYYLIPWIRKNHPDIAIVDYVHMEAWYWRNGGHARTSAVMGNIVEHTYVCNSATAAVMVEQLHRKAEIVDTVHIGVDEKYFDANRVRSGLLYEELQIDTKRPVVLFICRLDAEKRPLLMLQIAQRLKQRIPDVAFAVVGDGAMKDELINKCRSLRLEDTVYFLGAKNEVRRYYKDAKVTLICSIREGLALTAYESCAMGVPVVSADVGGQKDLIDDSVGALIPLMQDERIDYELRQFSQEEIDAYTETIVSILSDADRWNTLSANCRKRIEDGFSITTMTEFFNKELERIVKDENLKNQRRSISRALNEIGPLAEESCILNMAMDIPDQGGAGSNGPLVRNPGITNRLIVKTLDLVLKLHDDDNLVDFRDTVDACGIKAAFKNAYHRGGE